MIKIYTDGACSGNPGPGGYGWVAIQDLPYACYTPEGNKTICNQSTIIDYSSVISSKTTNNQAELSAMLQAFEYIETQKRECTIYCDSAYVVNIVNNWIYSWERNGWTRSKGQVIENLSIIKELYNYLITDFFKNQVKVVKVPGHSGVIGNELADALATNNIDKFHKLVVNNGLVIASD